VQAGKSYLGCHIHVDALVSRRNQPEAGVAIVFLKTTNRVYYESIKREPKCFVLVFAEKEKQNEKKQSERV
jgi:hypothetical protein